MNIRGISWNLFKPNRVASPIAEVALIEAETTLWEISTPACFKNSVKFQQPSEDL